MEDLDSLLEDLGRGKSSSTIKKQRPPSSRVDLNELEDLMEDLAAPTSKQMPAPTPVVIPATSAPVVMSTPKSEPPAPQPVPAAGQTATVDDLDALMESLNAASRSSSRRPPSTRVAPKQTFEPSPPSPVSAPAPAPAPASPPVQPASPKPAPYSAPAQPAYTPPPAQTYNPPPPQPTQTYNPPAAYTPPRPASQAPSSDLDNLLNNLTKQMNTIDVSNPASRGTCGTCGMAILGEVIQALGKTYHPEHFTCGSCHMPLGTATFYEQAGKPHCERCFQDQFCPRCGHCEKPILDRCITALGKKWHVEHFICTQCLRPFPNGNFFERDGRPYCEQDFYGLYAPKCGNCHEAIRGDCINALGQQWHPEHFVCAYCQKSFAGGCFFEHGGKPYCEIHYHQQSGSLCAGCGKPITGRCVNALDKKWHPEHFVCAFCMNPLAGGAFTEHNSKAYCKECHGKLFGQ